MKETTTSIEKSTGGCPATDKDTECLAPCLLQVEPQVSMGGNLEAALAKVVPTERGDSSDRKFGQVENGRICGEADPNQAAINGSGSRVLDKGGSA